MAADTKFSSGQTSGIAAGLNTNFANRPRLVNRQNLTSNVAVQNQLIQRGFSFVTYPGGQAQSNPKTITMPETFDDTNYQVILSVTGTKNGSDPTGPTDSSGTAQAVAYADLQTASEFVIQATDVAGNPASSDRHLISWLAIGTKA